MSVFGDLAVDREGRGMFVEHDRLTKRCVGGRTKQEFKDECDLNVLMKRYERTGALPSARVGQPQYVDCTVFTDFQTAMEIVRGAESSFNALPSRVRREFDNDPRKFVEFATNPENADRMIELGLLDGREPVPEPLEVKVVNPPAPQSEAP